MEVLVMLTILIMMMQQYTEKSTLNNENDNRCVRMNTHNTSLFSERVSTSWLEECSSKVVCGYPYCTARVL